MARRDYFYDPEAPKPTSIRPAAAVALFDSDGKTLLLRRKDNDKWTMPGGTSELVTKTAYISRLRRAELPGFGFCSRAYSSLSCLDCGQGNRVHNVVDQGSSGQIVYRAPQPLEHRTDAEHIRAALDRLVSRIPCIQVRKDE